jgi:phospholipid/cholesterol/gamma-HCH transport system substrate-binding protein
MHKNVIESLMGAVVLIVAAGFLSFAYNSSRFSTMEGYHLSAKFDSAAGLALGSDVKIGGIKIGVVSDMALDPNTYQAVVKMQIQRDTKLPTDSGAAVVSNGLLGDKYVDITPGAEEKMVKDGGTLQFTQSSVNIEQLIGKYVFSGGGVDSGSKSGKDSKAASDTKTGTDTEPKNGDEPKPAPNK